MVHVSGGKASLTEARTLSLGPFLHLDNFPFFAYHFLQGKIRHVMKHLKTITLISVFLVISAAGPLLSLSVGDIVKNIRIHDTRDNPAWLPDFGKKVLIIFYNDADVADQNDHTARALQRSRFPREYYRPLGIGNLKDAPWKPNSIIRLIARRKEKKYRTTILTDPSHILRDAWGLGDCNDRSVCIIISHSGKILYLYHGMMPEEEIQKVLEIVAEEVSRLKKLKRRRD